MHTLLENVGHEVENIDFIFFARALTNEVKPQENESKELYWFSRGKGKDVVKDTLNNFYKLLEITAPEYKKTLLQLIISKITIKDNKDIGSIELHFDEKVQKYFINNKEGECPDDGILLLLFCLR